MRELTYNERMYLKQGLKLVKKSVDLYYEYRTPINVFFLIYGIIY